MTRIAWIGLWLAPWLVAPSAVYRCDSGGSVTWTDHACVAGDFPADLPAIGSVPSVKGVDLAKQYDERAKRERDAHEKADHAWLESHAAKQEAERKAEDARLAERAARRKAAREGYTVRPAPASEEAKRR